MNCRDALHILTYGGVGYTKQELDDAIGIIEQLVEKETPKAPITWVISGPDVCVLDKPECPNCGGVVNTDHDRCPDCGQMIDWGNKE